MAPSPFGRLDRLFDSFYTPSPFPLFEDMLTDLPSVTRQIIHLDFYEVIDSVSR